jgi:hypothetical protein
MNEDGCKKCTGCTDCIVSVSAPQFWAKIKIETGLLVFAYDCYPNNGMRTVAAIKFCPFCGKELNK